MKDTIAPPATGRHLCDSSAIRRSAPLIYELAGPGDLLIKLSEVAEIITVMTEHPVGEPKPHVTNHLVGNS